METIKEIMHNSKYHLNIRNVSDVYNEIQKTLKKIDEYVTFNEYRYSNKIDISNKQLTDALIDSSLKRKKVLRKYMYKINSKPTLQFINKFLHFLFKQVLKSDTRVKVLKSEKEQSIIAKREAFVKARQAMLKAKSEYLQEKGEFYKIRMSKNQSI